MKQPDISRIEPQVGTPYPPPHDVQDARAFRALNPIAGDRRTITGQPIPQRTSGDPHAPP